MAGIEEAFEKFVKKISDTEEESENKNLKFGRDVYAPEEGLFFKPVQKNQSSFAERLRSDPRLSPPLPNMRERDLTPEERIRLGDNQYFMSQDRPEYASPVVQGQGFNKRDVKDFAREYIQTQTPLGGGIGYQGPEYGVMAIKPFVGPDRSALLQAYYNTDNEGSRIQAMLSPKEQQIGYTGNTGTTFSAGRNTFQGSPYYTLNLSKSFADGGVASMFRERPGYQEGGSTSGLMIQLDRPVQPGHPVGSFFNQSGSGLTAVDTKPGFTPQSRPSLVEDFYKSSFYDPKAMGTMALVPVTLPTGEKFTFSGGADSAGFEEYVKSLGYSTNRGDGSGYNVIAPTPTVPAPTIPTPVTQPLTPETGLPVTTMPVTQPTAEAPINSLEKFIAERKFQAEADAAARSNVPFTKTFSDYLPTPTMAAPTLTTNLEQNLISNNLSRLFPENNFYDSLRTNPITSNMQGIYNTSFNRRPIDSAFSPTSILGSLESRMGEFQPFVNRLNLSQQDAAARVTPRIFGRDGGRVSMSEGGLTNTIPPAKGPDSQGVESLFRRRYN